jgi:septum formation protein
MAQSRKIVLASGSPRRKELLEKIGVEFTVDPSDYPEDWQSTIQINKDLGIALIPEKLAQSISIRKAAAVAPKYPNAIIIAADTLGVLRGKVIGKPRTPDEARQMLQALSGKSHRVVTAFTILDSKNNKMVTRAVVTRVYFKKLDHAEIDNYVKTGEPLDKAGAYAIQGKGSIFVEKIDGDYYNVMGLPLNSLSESLKEFGVQILQG